MNTIGVGDYTKTLSAHHDRTPITTVTGNPKNRKGR